MLTQNEQLEVMKKKEEIDSLPKDEQVKEISNMIGMDVDSQDIQHATMTDEQLNDMCNVLSDNRSEVLQERMNFDSEEYNEYINQLQSEKHSDDYATVTVNSNTGASLITATETEDSEEFDEEFDLIKIFDEQKSEITIDMCKRSFEEIYGVYDEKDQIALYNAIMDVDNVKFDTLPVNIKTLIAQSSGENNNGQKSLDEFTKFILNNMKTDIVADKAINIDLDNEIKKFREESGKLMDEALEHNRTLLQKELTKQANELEAKGFKSKAKQIRRCVQGFIDSYTYNPLYREWKFLRIKGKRVSIKKYLDNELANYKQHTMVFDNRYRNSKLNIHSSSLIAPTLRRHLPNESEENVMKFAILFCMYSALLDQKNWEDHIFMYYTIYNIIALDAVKDKSQGLANEVLVNVQKVIDTVIK